MRRIRPGRPEASTTKFFSVDIEGLEPPWGPITLSNSSSRKVVSQPAIADGNKATFNADVKAVGNNTYAEADAAVTTTDQFSDSIIVATATADTALL
jgi:hypothetical protein